MPTLSDLRLNPAAAARTLGTTAAAAPVTPLGRPSTPRPAAPGPAAAPDASIGAGIARLVEPVVGRPARTSPTDAVFGAKPVDAPVAPPARARTLKPAAGIGSTSESAQTTGPLAQPLNFPPNAALSIWALPGSTVRVYTTAVLEDGKPKLLETITAPLTDDGAQPHSMSGAYPTMNAFNEAAAKFKAAKAPGMVLATARLGVDHDHSAQDTFLITQQAGSRPESEPVAVTLFAYSAPRRPHKGAFEPQYPRMSLASGVLGSTEAWAMRPGTYLETYVDGHKSKVAAAVDGEGRFALDLSSLGDLSKVVVTANGKPLALGALGVGEALPDARARVAAWDAALLKGLLSPDASGVVDFTIAGLPKGLALTLTNPNSGSKTFTVEDGKLHVQLADTWAGDSILATLSAKNSGADVQLTSRGDGTTYESVRIFASEDGKSSPRAYPLAMDGTYFVPEPAQAARIGQIIDALAGFPRIDLQNAITLFGPHAQAVKGCESVDGPTLRALYEGARLGAQLAPAWADKAIAHLTANGESAHVVEGIKIGQAYRKQRGALPSSGDELGLRQVKAGDRRMVITGGYSPISGSHGPLTPETVTGPATWELKWKDLPPLTLMTQGTQPSGWVNPAAIGFTFGISPGGGATFDYSYSGG